MLFPNTGAFGIEQGNSPGPLDVAGNQYGPDLSRNDPSRRPGTVFGPRPAPQPLGPGASLGPEFSRGAPGAETPEGTPDPGQGLQLPEIPIERFDQIRNARREAKERARTALEGAGIDPNALYDQYLERSGANKDIERLPKLNTEEKALLMVDLGLRMMSAGERPGASLLGALGEAGQGTLGQYREMMGERRAEQREDRRMAREDSRFRTEMDMRNADRELERDLAIIRLDQDELRHEETMTLQRYQMELQRFGNQVELQQLEMARQRLEAEMERLGQKTYQFVVDSNTHRLLAIDPQNPNGGAIAVEFGGQPVMGATNTRGALTAPQLTQIRSNVFNRVSRQMERYEIQPPTPDVVVQQLAREYQSTRGMSQAAAQAAARETLASYGEGADLSAILQDSLENTYMHEEYRVHGLIDERPQTGASGEAGQGGALPPPNATQQPGGETSGGPTATPGALGRIGNWIGEHLEEGERAAEAAWMRNIIEGRLIHGRGENEVRSGGLLLDIAQLLNSNNVQGYWLGGGRKAMSRLVDVLESDIGREMLLERLGQERFDRVVQLAAEYERNN